MADVNLNQRSKTNSFHFFFFYHRIGSSAEITDVKQTASGLETRRVEEAFFRYFWCLVHTKELLKPDESYNGGESDPLGHNPNSIVDFLHSKDQTENHNDIHFY